MLYVLFVLCCEFDYSLILTSPVANEKGDRRVVVWRPDIQYISLAGGRWSILKSVAVAAAANTKPRCL